MKICAALLLALGFTAALNGETVSSVLTTNVLGSSANYSSYTTVMSAVEAGDIDAENAWARLDSAAAVQARGAALRAAMIDRIGGFPSIRCPLNAQAVGTVERNGYRVEKVMFESWPNVHVTANLFLPDSPQYSAPYPAVIVPCGHTAEGKAYNLYQRGCVQLALAGIAALVYDPWDQGERYQTGRTGNTAEHNRVGALAALLGGSMARFRIWDGMRALDYLETRSEIDATRFGCMGQSGGGTMTSLLMAVEPRLKAACPANYITTYRAACAALGPQDAEQQFFGMLAVGVNHASFALMQAPLPVRFMFCHGDMFPFAGSQVTDALVEGVAARCGWSDRYGMTDVDGDHEWKESARTSSVEWMRRWLCNDLSAFRHDLEGYRALDRNFNPANVDMGLSVSQARCRPDGKVTTIAGERTVYDLLRSELAAAVASRVGTMTPASLRAFANIAEPGEGGVVHSTTAHGSGSGFTFTRETFAWPNGLVLPAVAFVPDNIVEAPALIIGSGARADRASMANTALAQGRVVMVADVLGTGEIGGYKHTFYSTAVAEEEVGVLLWALGLSLPAVQAEEVLEMAAELKSRYGRAVKLVAKGRTAIAAAHARLARPDLVAEVECRDAPESWSASIASGASVPFANVVNGALRKYDWVDLPGMVKVASAQLAVNCVAGLDWRQAEVSVSVDNLELGYYPAATLTVRAKDGAGNVVGEAVREVTADGAFELTFSNLVAGGRYVFEAELTVAGEGGRERLASNATGASFAHRVGGWIDEDASTFAGESAARWNHGNGRATVKSGEIAIAAENSQVAFTPTSVTGTHYAVEQRVRFDGPVGTVMTPEVASAKAAVALVPARGKWCNFVLLDHGAWHTNTVVQADMDAEYRVRITIDETAHGVVYDLVGEDGRVTNLHACALAGAAGVSEIAWQGNGYLLKLDGDYSDARVAEVEGRGFATVAAAVAESGGAAVKLVHAASYAPASNAVFRINAAGYTLVMEGEDWGAFNAWAKRHPEVLDGSLAVGAGAAKVSSLLDLDGLVPQATLDALESKDVTIESARLVDGAVEVALKVKGLPVGEGAQREHIRKVFGILGADDPRSPFAGEGIEYLAGPDRLPDGAVRFQVRPKGDTRPRRYFFKGAFRR